MEIAHCSAKMVLAWEIHCSQVVGQVWVDNFQDNHCIHPCCRHQSQALGMNLASYSSQAMELMTVLLASSLHRSQSIELLAMDQFHLDRIDTRMVKYFLYNVFSMYTQHYYLHRSQVNQQHLSRSYFW